MPVNKNAMTRYKILDDLLSDSYRHYSLNDLTNEVSNRLCDLDPSSGGVVRRTIEKDIHYLESEGPFMVDIERYSVDVFDPNTQRTVCKKCLRYAASGFSIFKKEMSVDEKLILSQVLSLLGQIDGLPNLDGLEHLRAGLQIPIAKHIISFTKNPLSQSNLLGELFTAISQRQVIRILYHKFGEDDEKMFVLHPYLLKEYNRRWYLLGALDGGSAISTFGLERVDDVTFLPDIPYKDYEGDLEQYFEDIIGVTNYADKTVETILFWASDSSSRYISTKPLHDSQKHFHSKTEEQLRLKYPHFKGGSFFSIECKENYELLRELTSFGRDLVVLEPKALTQQVQQHIEDMRLAYSFV